MSDPQKYIADIKSAATDALQKNYFQFKGRAARPAYWWYALAYFVVYIVVSLPGVTMLSMILSLALLLPTLGLGVRRLHDINMSGWWMLVGIIPVLGWGVMIYWAIQPGTSGPNDYGPAPTVPTISTAG